MEHLSKAQIVLLTLFVSFVSSMATGIVVVTLMQQAPDPIVQSITNVVERTIEKITPAPADKTPKTVVVKDEDLVVAAIDRNIQSTVAFSVVGQEGEVQPAGVGTIVSRDGLVITDRENFGVGVLTTKIDGIQYALQVISDEEGNSLGLGKLTTTGVATTTVPSFTPVTLGNLSGLKLGQTTIVIGGRDGKTILSGFISSLDFRTVTGDDKKTETKVLNNIGISTRPSGTSSGAPIINLNGEVIGFLSIDDIIGYQKGIPATEAQTLLDKQAQPVTTKKI